MQRGHTYTSERTFNQTLRDFLYSQVQMILRHPRMRYYDGPAANVPRSLAEVSPNRTVDPDLFELLPPKLPSPLDRRRSPPSTYHCRNPGTPYPEGELPDDFTDDLVELARGALFNLAYGPGNVTSGTPPNLDDFMAEDGSLNWNTMYRAHYGYWIENQPGHARGPWNGSEANVCHYHYLNLKLFWDALELTEQSIFLRTNLDLHRVRYALLYGREEDSPDAYTACTGDAASSLSIVRHVPLAEFFVSARTAGRPFQRAGGWPSAVNHCTTTARAFMDPVEGDAWGEARIWFEEKYDGCWFVQPISSGP